MKLALVAPFLLLPSLVFAQSVDILYAGNTYTPPFYQGGALWSGESTITLFAVPQGLGNPATLSYKWRQGTEVLGDRSGIGRSTLTFPDTIFSKPQIFSVDIVDGNDQVLAQAYVNVTPVAPSLLIYEKHPLYGFLFNQEATPSYQLTNTESTFGAFPLFFSTPSRTDPTTNYSWQSSAGTDSTESEATYRTPAGATGQSQISVSATNPSTIRQAANTSFLVQFGNGNQ